MPEEILDGKRILIVDDELDILETLEDLLDSSLIDTAPSFEAANKFLEKNSYDVIVIDIMGVKGYDLLRIANEKNIPALMLTAHALSPDSLIKSIKEGAQSYVPKDKITDIPLYIRDILVAKEKGMEKHGQWFTRLKPFFDKKFGPDWRKKDEAFWNEYDESYKSPFSKDELENIM